MMLVQILYKDRPVKTIAEVEGKHCVMRHSVTKIKKLATLIAFGNQIGKHSMRVQSQISNTFRVVERELTQQYEKGIRHHC